MEFRAASWHHKERPDLSGVHLNITVVIGTASIYDTYAVQGPDGIPILRPCFVREILIALQYALNFTYTLKGTDHWGYFDSEASRWQGAIGDLLDGNADLGLSSTVQLQERQHLVYYNTPLYSWKFLALYAVPDLRSDTLALFKPFEIEIWIFLLASLCFCALALLVIRALHNCITRPNGSFMEPKHQFLWGGKAGGSESYASTGDCIFWITSATCMKAVHHVPSQTPMRLIILTVFLLIVLLNAAYSGMLVSFLSVSTKPYTTLGQLLRTLWRFDAVTGVPLGVMENATSTRMEIAISRVHQQQQLSTNVSRAKRDILRGSYVYLAYEPAAYGDLRSHYTGSERCSIREVTLPIARPKVGTIMAKSSPHKRIIDGALLRTIQFGLDSRWIQRHIPMKPTCTKEHLPSDGVAFASVSIPVYILVLGTFISLLVLFVESQFCKCKRTAHLIHP